MSPILCVHAAWVKNGRFCQGCEQAQPTRTICSPTTCEQFGGRNVGVDSLASIYDSTVARRAFVAAANNPNCFETVRSLSTAVSKLYSRLPTNPKDIFRFRMSYLMCHVPRSEAVNRRESSAASGAEHASQANCHCPQVCTSSGIETAGCAERDRCCTFLWPLLSTCWEATYNLPYY